MSRTGTCVMHECSIKDEEDCPANRTSWEAVFFEALQCQSMNLIRKGMCRQAEEDNAVRFEELGLDRRHNRYWHFAAGTELGSGLIYIELQVSPAFVLWCKTLKPACCG